MTSFLKDFLGDGYRTPCWLRLLHYYGYALTHIHAFL